MEGFAVREQPSSTPPDAARPAVVEVVMLSPVSFSPDGRPPRTYGAGQLARVPRAVAARWLAAGWAKPGDGPALTSAELLEGAREAFQQLQRECAESGAGEERFYAIPARRRRLDALVAYLDALDGGNGSGPRAA